MGAATQQQQQHKQPAAEAAVAGATKTSAEEEALKRNTDCVYFLASPLTCKKGSECEYRHSEYARVNPRDCYFWLNGNCMNPKCGFRHPPLDGLLGSQVAAPAGSSMSSSHMAATPTPVGHTPYNQGVPYNSKKPPVPCIFFQKGLCLKGDRCAFLHSPTTSNKAPQPAATITATEPSSFKKAFGGPETSQLQKFPPTNVSKTVGLPPEGKSAPKLEATSARSGTATERSVPDPPGLDEELPRHKGTNTTSAVNCSYMGRSNRLHQLHVSDEPSFHAGKEADEFLRESSPGFDVLVDDELGDSDFYHGGDRYGGTRGHEGRNVNDYDIHPTDYDAMVDVDQEMFHDGLGYDSFDHVQGNYGWDQQRASSERISLGPSTLERRDYSRVDTPPDHVDGSDLRHLLAKRRRVNGLRSVVSQDHAIENHEEERNYRGSNRESHHLSPQEGSLSTRLRGRIKLPGRSLINGTDLHSERERERGRNWGRLSPGKPQTSSHLGRLRDRIKGRVEGEYNNKEGRSFGGPRIGREIMDERNADFTGPKSLAELKVGKNTNKKDHLSLGKRKSIEDHQETEGDISFEGPMPLSEILKRKRQSKGADFGSGIASASKEDDDQKQSEESLIGSSTKTVVSATPGEAKIKEESKSTIADIGATEVAHGESSQLLNISEHEIDDQIIGDERMEDQELEGDDKRDGDYYYEQGEGEYNYEDGENVDPEEEEYIEEEDGDDFAKKLGVMFS